MAKTNYPDTVSNPPAAIPPLGPVFGRHAAPQRPKGDLQLMAEGLMKLIAPLVISFNTWAGVTNSATGRPYDHSDYEIAMLANGMASRQKTLAEHNPWDHSPMKIEWANKPEGPAV